MKLEILKAEETWRPLVWWELVGVQGPLVGIRWFEADCLGTGATSHTLYNRG